MPGVGRSAGAARTSVFHCLRHKEFAESSVDKSRHECRLGTQECVRHGSRNKMSVIGEPVQVKTPIEVRFRVAR